VKSSRELKAVTERLMLFTKLVGRARRTISRVFRTLFDDGRAFTKAGVTVDRRFGCR
jgi:hypothetical protein